MKMLLTETNLPLVRSKWSSFMSLFLPGLFQWFLSDFAGVTCTRLSTHLSHGSVDGVDNSYNSRVTFSCNAGWFITNEKKTVKTRVLTCQNNGQWSTAVPTCSSKF